MLSHMTDLIFGESGYCVIPMGSFSVKFFVSKNEKYLYTNFKILILKSEIRLLITTLT